MRDQISYLSEGFVFTHAYFKSIPQIKLLQNVSSQKKKGEGLQTVISNLGILADKNKCLFALEISILSPAVYKKLIDMAVDEAQILPVSSVNFWLSQLSRSRRLWNLQIWAVNFDRVKEHRSFSIAF